MVIAFVTFLHPRFPAPSLFSLQFISCGELNDAFAITILKIYACWELMRGAVHHLTITYYWIVSLILDHSYLVGNLSNSEINETKALDLLKS